MSAAAAPALGRRQSQSPSRPGASPASTPEAARLPGRAAPATVAARTAWGPVTRRVVASALIGFGGLGHMATWPHGHMAIELAHAMGARSRRAVQRRKPNRGPGAGAVASRPPPPAPRAGTPGPRPGWAPAGPSGASPGNAPPEFPGLARTPSGPAWSPPESLPEPPGVPGLPQPPPASPRLQSPARPGFSGRRVSPRSGYFPVGVGACLLWEGVGGRCCAYACVSCGFV